METALLIDIGSTYTKVVHVNLDVPELIGRSRAVSTVEFDVNQGLRAALKEIDGWQKARYKLACSSAAGGLKIIAIGLVPGLTAEAARRAALGAGSRVIRTYSYELTADELAVIEEEEGDLILLAGGTDGGNRETILHNARMLARSRVDLPIIIAGNKSVSGEVQEIFNRTGKESWRTENVMPGLEELNIEPARKMIRDLFIKRIVQARGLDRVRQIIDGVIMPTPAAVFQAAVLLADGSGSERGLGELMIIDVGGATTDVYSIASGEPVRADVHWRGLKEPCQKRTVEGDLGIRYSVGSLYQIVGRDSFRRQLNSLKRPFHRESEQIYPELIKKMGQQVDYLCHRPEERVVEDLLARNAVRISVERHTGYLKTIYTPRGSTLIQEGKDLSGLGLVVGTGGVIINSEQPEFILSGTCYQKMTRPELLAPIEPDFLIDSEYILPACGLLAEKEPGVSLKLLKRYLKELGDRDDSQK